MARFHFSLQTVLEQREHEERLCQLGLASAQQAMAQLEKRLGEIDGEVRAVNIEMRDRHLTGMIDVHALGAQRRYLAAMKAQIIQLAQQMATARLSVEASQRKLADAAKQRKAIELLRDKQKGRWLVEQDKKERELLDEASMQIAYDNLRLDLAERTAGSAA